MNTQIDIPMAEKGQNKRRTVEASGIRYLLERFRNWITKYVTIDKDAIFKDPDWPHMWEHKR